MVSQHRKVEDAIPEWDVNLGTASEAPIGPAYGNEDSPSHTHAFVNTQGVNRNQMCFSDLLSGWELMIGAIAVLW